MSDPGTKNAAYYGQYLEGALDHPDVAGVRLITSPNHRCSFAEQYAGYYRLQDVPDYPPGPCDNDPCCFCYAEVVYADEVAGGVEWKTPVRRHVICQVSRHPPKPPPPTTERSLREFAEVVNKMGISTLDESDVQAMIENTRQSGKLHDEAGNVIPPRLPSHRCLLPLALAVAVGVGLFFLIS